MSRLLVDGCFKDMAMSFRVTVLPAERSFEVGRDEAMLAAALRQGIGLPYGCKDGACGSCRSRLLEGRVIHGAHQAKALSDVEEAQGLILTCCATPQSDCVVESRQVVASGQFAVQKLPVRVSALERVASDVIVMTLQLPANQNFRYHAGQFLEFILRDGSRRSYSMANAWQAGNSSIELHLRHLPGGKFTDQVFASMKVKDILRVEGPFGSFFLREDSAKPIVLLASGTGFAPIKAIVEQMRAAGISRPARLYWGCRQGADLYQDAWAREAAALLPWLSYIPVLSEPQADAGWSGRTGFVHQAVMADLPDLSGHQVYACGVPIMVNSARRDFVAHCGLPEEEFYADPFVSEADKH
jgi:CDP-4-dehydro-6-deoxyglucose reductase